MLRHLNNRLPFEDPLRLVTRCFSRLHSIWVSLTYPFASKGRNLWIHQTCDLSRLKAHRIKLGSSVQIRRDSLINVVSLPELPGEPVIVIDDNTCIGAGSQISAKNRIHIERDVLVGQRVLMVDHSQAHEDATRQNCEQAATEGGRIRIGHGTWIGYGAAFVCTHGELVLGHSCVVAANALVTTSFPPHSVILGNPGRAIKHFNAKKNSWVIGSPLPAETEATER